MRQKLKFTLWHGLAASLAIHSILGAPFVVHGLERPNDEAPVLVVELQGAVSDSQAVQRVLQQTRGDERQEQAPAAKPEPTPPPEPASPDRPPDQLADNGDQPPPEPETTAPSTAKQTDEQPARPATEGGANDVKGVEEQRTAQTVKQDDDADRLAEYIKSLSKKIESHLVYPDEGRQAALQGVTTVSFRVLGNGQIRPETLKVVASSGQPKLDAIALNTIRASVPFDPPPKEMTIAIGVAYGRKH
jgi:periplasmic protein TonB